MSRPEEAQAQADADRRVATERMVKMLAFAVLAVVFTFGDLGLNGYVLGAGLCVMLLWVKPSRSRAR